MVRLSGLFVAAVLVNAACSRPATPPSVPHPAIVLITLDTTRADSIGPEAKGITTPGFDALASRGVRFRQAYATVPQTLASHASMLTGLYPPGHGLHENGRYLSEGVPLLTEKLHAAGYRTAAFVSSFALARRFGLARGFDIYDDEMPAGRAERTAAATTDRALRYLEQPSTQPLFLWVHYYEPHYPYEPPEPYRSQFAANPYLGEIAAMDAQVARLGRAIEQQITGPVAIVVAADHGEGLGEHGEAFHGNLIYQSTMHVPLVVSGPGVTPGVSDAPVSIRRTFDTILDFAGAGDANSLRHARSEVVAGEGMNPYLDYGWQPQVMAVDGRMKAILAGRLEVYDVVADPGERHDLAASANLSRAMRMTLQEYPLPSFTTPPPATDEARRKLASLGYIASQTRPVVRKNAPRAVDMAFLFDPLEHANSLFIRQKYAEVVPLLQKILKADPENLHALLHLATSYSQLGRDTDAVATFAKAETIAPGSEDVRTFLGVHYARGKDWQKAIPLLEGVVANSPDRLPALEALAVVRERQGKMSEALDIHRKIFTLRPPAPTELLRMAQIEAGVGQTDAAIASLEKLRSILGPRFGYDLQLGVLYQATGRFEAAKQALDRVSPSHPGYAMALFKRAQISVMLRDPDRNARIEAARAHADATTEELIERDPMFGE